jgi:hypothetical protein
VIEWIIENGKWLFSGAGVAVVIGVWKYFVGPQLRDSGSEPKPPVVSAADEHTEDSPGSDKVKKHVSIDPAATSTATTTSSGSHHAAIDAFATGCNPSPAPLRGSKMVRK